MNPNLLLNMSIQDLDSPTSSEDEEFSLDSIKLHTE
jgi:hypothetical protein